ncbi:MAG: hypothetical protein R3E13_00055 [Alphaproteobacteria bacterium]
MKHFVFKLLGTERCTRLAQGLGDLSSKAARYVERNSPGPGFSNVPIERNADFKTAYDRLVFLRLGHTGSWSFWDSISQCTPTRNRVSIDWKPEDLNAALDHINSLSETDKNNIQLIGLHCAYPVHTHFSGTTKYVTLLRDPVKTAVSKYFWQYNHRHDLSADWVCSEIRDGMSLSAWVENIMPDSIYARWILRLNNKEIGDFQNRTEDILTECMVIINDMFLMVGITERFDESLYMFSCLSGQHAVPLWRHLGQSNAPRIEDLNPAILKRIEEKTDIDRQLFALCKDRFMPPGMVDCGGYTGTKSG